MITGSFHVSYNIRSGRANDMTLLYRSTWTDVHVSKELPGEALPFAERSFLVNSLLVRANPHRRSPMKYASGLTRMNR
jgi:hypothetical protein